MERREYTPSGAEVKFWAVIAAQDGDWLGHCQRLGSLFCEALYSRDIDDGPDIEF